MSGKEQNHKGMHETLNFFVCLLPSSRRCLGCRWEDLCSAELDRPFPGMSGNFGEKIRLVGQEPGSKCLRPFPRAATCLKCGNAFKGLDHAQDRGEPNL